MRCKLVLVIVTTVLVVPLLLVALLKRVRPGRRARLGCTRLATRIAQVWVVLVARTFDAAYTTCYAVIDVTIRYPDRMPGMWDFLGNRIPEVEVHVRRIPLPESIKGGDYQDVPEYRKRFRQWLNDIWSEKDALIERMGGNSTR